jgi:hypothetical protein
MKTLQSNNSTNNMTEADLIRKFIISCNKNSRRKLHPKVGKHGLSEVSSETQGALAAF